jgi:hypothetical protein
MPLLYLPFHSSAAQNYCRNASYLRNMFAGFTFTINEKDIHFINYSEDAIFSFN